MELTISARLGYEPAPDMDARKFFYAHSTVMKDHQEEQAELERKGRTGK